MSEASMGSATADATVTTLPLNIIVYALNLRVGQYSKKQLLCEYMILLLISPCVHGSLNDGFEFLQ